MNCHTLKMKPTRMCDALPSYWNARWLRFSQHWTGRIMLHVVVFARTRRNWRWHWEGIRREFPFRFRKRPGDPTGRRPNLKQPGRPCTPDS